MTSLWQDHSIDAGCFINSIGVLLSLSTDATSNAGIEHSQLILYATDNGAVREIGTYPWKIVSLAMTYRNATSTGYALGENGPLIRIEQSGTHDLSAALPQLRGPLRKVRPVGDAMVIVGMRHQVIAEHANDQCDDLSPIAATGPLGGFEAVAGESLDNFICAGWNGEIWQRLKGRWNKLDSPTNVLITDIAQGPDGTYVACGLAGLIVMGQGDEWRVLDQGRFNLNLYSVVYHAGRFYVSSMYGLYELRDDEKLYDISYDTTPSPTTAHTVQSVGRALGLIGAKDLYLRDGPAWKRFE